MRIAAFISAGNEPLTDIRFSQFDGWKKASLRTREGRAELWIQLDQNAVVPGELLE